MTTTPELSDAGKAFMRQYVEKQIGASSNGKTSVSKTEDEGSTPSESANLKKTTDIPNGWHVSWMGKDKDGMFVAQLKLTESLDPKSEIDDNTMTFVSRVGYTWIEALTSAVSAIEKHEEAE